MRISGASRFWAPNALRSEKARAKSGTKESRVVKARAEARSRELLAMKLEVTKLANWSARTVSPLRPPKASGSRFHSPPEKKPLLLPGRFMRPPEETVA